MTTDLPFTATRAPPCTAASLPISLSFPTHAGSKAGLIAQLTLSSPQNLNALRSEDVQMITAILEWIDEQKEILITVLTGTGRFFSAGASLTDPARVLPKEVTDRDETDPIHVLHKRQWANGRVQANNARITHAFFNHSKLLVAALNGPAVGISAALLGHCDLIYCFEEFWLATPFTTLALVVEGGASKTFVQKMGLGRAQQALLEGRRMPARELLEAGFVSTIFPAPAAPPSGTDMKKHTPPILDYVLPHLVDKFLPPIADEFALLSSKKLLRDATYGGKSFVEANDSELHGAREVFTSGRPLKQFQRLASGGRHKL